ncbi:recombination-associated protein RdgC [Permianibacter sp. IMCC34836]|uniref:recombination-associated protein RdgC n=1 Tax=Permianibacter fluminis TaxID=2738515 RepID=UPI001553A3A3|nr:recombination-associated protein RdgC [Permianibacter fluminis]NQD35414.1 recombination-associated protein RdgC [Permianibacter fluminis]
MRALFLLPVVRPMQFRHLCLYRIRPEALPNLETLEAALREQPFAPCGATEPQRVGWVPALDDESTAYVHSGSGTGTWLVRLREQRRLLPAGVIREQLEDQVRQIQDKEGRKLGKKEIVRLKDELMFTLLPRAFTKTGDTLALIAPEAGLILVGAGSLTKGELLLNALRLALGSLPVARPAFSAPIPAFLTAWLQGEREMPAGFTLEDACEIADEEGTVRCKGIDLVSDEIRKHLELGREVRKLALTFEDSLSFTLLPDARLANMKLSERLSGELDSQFSGDKFENLDAEYQLWSLTLLRLLPRLLSSIGETAS